MIIVDRVQRHYLRFRDADAETRMWIIRRRYIPVGILALLLPVRIVLAVVLRAVLLVLKPVVHIRFGRYPSVSLGTLGIPMELYLCKKDAGLHPPRSLDLFFHWKNTAFLIKKNVRIQDDVCNQQLHTMFKRKLRIRQTISKLDHLNRLLPWGSDTFIVPDNPQYDQWGMLERFPVHLAFSEEEEQYGLATLREMGVEAGAPFVCFYARDGVYISRHQPRVVSIYGEWDETVFRNADIKTYIPAVEELVSRGYYALRAGKWTKDTLEHDNHMVIDYPNSHHSDFMDIFLSARCAFFIGMNGGIIHPPSIFRRPMALANVIPLADVVDACADTVSIPKKFYSAEKGRLLTFKEILSNPILAHYKTRSRTQNPELFDTLGLEILDNTPEEIMELAVEMDQRVHCTFQPSQEDQELQNRYVTILEENKEIIPPFGDLKRLRMGAHFLRANSGLLE